MSLEEKPESRSQNPEGGKRKRRRPWPLHSGYWLDSGFFFRSGFWLLASGFFLASPGCSDKPDGHDRSEQALKDPMHYSPGIEKPDTRKKDPYEFDKPGLQKDLDNVLNP